MTTTEKYILAGASVLCIIVLIILILVFTLTGNSYEGDSIPTLPSNTQAMPLIEDYNGPRGPTVLNNKLIFDKKDKICRQRYNSDCKMWNNFDKFAKTLTSA